MVWCWKKTPAAHNGGVGEVDVFVSLKEIWHWSSEGVEMV